MATLPKEPPAREITPEDAYRRRREFIKNAGLMAGSAALVGTALQWITGRGVAPPPDDAAAATVPLTLAKPSASAINYDTSEEKTPYRDVTTYNNFYEFGTSKSQPARNAHTLKPRPWTVAIGGETEQPRTLDFDDIMKMVDLEERVYRMRCVEAWSMVIPWNGFPLGAFLKKLKPTSKAKYVAFQTLLDPVQMPGQRSAALDWPYVEGLRIDEAMNPLALLATGLYGKTLPGQNGAPLRLVAPWKYGFKGIKSIVSIRFTETQPAATWNLAAPDEYGFYANVNPDVPHPRWLEDKERRIGDLGERPTLKFNGYGEHVAGLYAGLDLKKNF